MRGDRGEKKKNKKKKKRKRKAVAKGGNKKIHFQLDSVNPSLQRKGRGDEKQQKG